MPPSIPGSLDAQSTPSRPAAPPVVCTPRPRHQPHVCRCYFGADRCASCEASRSQAAERRNKSPAEQDSFSKLPDDVLERIALATGKDLPAFASVSHAVRLIVRCAASIHS
jgi:hypothetical protein